MELLRRAQKTHRALVPSGQVSSIPEKTAFDASLQQLSCVQAVRVQWDALSNSQNFYLVTSKINQKALHMKMLNERTLLVSGVK